MENQGHDQAKAAPSSLLERVNALGVGISPVSLDEPVATVNRAMHSGNQGYVWLAAVHSVMACGNDSSLWRRDIQYPLFIWLIVLQPSRLKNYPLKN